MEYIKIPTPVMKQLNEDLKQNKRFKNNMFAGTEWEALFPAKTLMDLFGEELSKIVSTLLGYEVQEQRKDKETGHDHYAKGLGRVEDKGIRAEGSIINQIRPNNGFDYLRVIAVNTTVTKVYQCSVNDLFRKVREDEEIKTHRTPHGKEKFTVDGLDYFEGWVSLYPWITINNGFAINTTKIEEFSKVATLIAEGDMYWEN